uniref:RNA-directed DNA polymerase n=2 Tax=Ixodes ricinus TaxID=34613 RepID=A0A090XF40_IXORI
MINKVLASQLWKVCLAYLDDIIVFSRTVDDHLQDLRGIFEALSEAGLRLQPRKCKVAASSVLYLGHVIDGKSVRPDPDNIRAASNFPRPRNVKEVRSFLGVCNYYRRFVKDFARISRPLNDLTRCDVKWSWSQECQNAFEELKQHLTREPVLRLFDPSLPIEVHTDACGYGIGAVLVQRDGTQEYAVGYASRHLNAAEANYSTTEQECLAVVYATRQFRPYLFGVPFTVVTDQSSLTWLMTVKNPNGRLIRWSLLLQEFNIALKHRPGKKNGNADALSRLPYDPAPQEEEELPLLLVEGGDIVQNQRADRFLGPIVGHLERPQNPVVRKVKRAARAFSLVNGILFRRAKGYEAERLALAVPRTMRQEILVSCHDDVTAGHLGIKRTIDKIRQRYFWPRMFADITRYVMSCPDCQTRKTPPLRPAGLLQPLPPAQRPFQRVGMDFLGPLTSSQDGNKYVVVIIDYHTKWVETVATPDATAASAAKAFMQAVVLRHGAPETVLTDRGRHFVSEMMEELFRLLDTNHARTTAYHPQTNGLCERFNRTLADMISKYVSSSHQDWDQFLPYATFAYNSSVHDTTGYSPFFLLYGHEPTLPIDAMLHLQLGHLKTPSNEEVMRRWESAKQIVAERERRAQRNNKERYDQHRRTSRFKPGDLVYIRMPTSKRGRTTKFLHAYHGPFRVVRQTAENDWEVENRKGKLDVVNVNRMKPFVVRDENSERGSSDDSTETDTHDGPTGDHLAIPDIRDEEEFHDAQDAPTQDQACGEPQHSQVSDAVEAPVPVPASVREPVSVPVV